MRKFTTINTHKVLVILLLAVLFSSSFGFAGRISLGTGRAARNPQTIEWPAIRLVDPLGGFSSPVHITHAGDGSNRLFIVEQAGRIRIVKNGQLLTQPFLDIQARVLFSGEQGLLSVAFPPSYAANGTFYVYYTNKDGDNVVARFQVTGNPDLADPSSGEQILLLSHPNYGNHNGGQLAFGPDGYLYIATGDGGGGGDPQGNAQNFSSLLGKILRIDVEFNNPSPVQGPYRLYIPLARGSASGKRYAIPPDNPYAGKPGARGEIWALGLRNPWRFSFDRLTGDLYIGDVGQGRYEEIDFQTAGSPGGENYGWNIMEGAHCYNASTCDQSGLVLPILEYEHGASNTIGCSVTGGFVYRGPGNPGMQGFYFYADFCSGRIWAAMRDQGNWHSQEVLDTAYSIPTFGEDESGNLFLVHRGSGTIYRIEEAP